MNLNESAPEVGLFFVIDGVVYGYGEPMRDLAPYYDDFVNYDETHLEYFDDLVSVFPALHKYRNHDYGEFPRGRVLYDKIHEKFIIYADKCVLNNSDLKSKISEEFHIPMSIIDWKWDEHYVCAKCDEQVKMEARVFSRLGSDLSD